MEMYRTSSCNIEYMKPSETAQLKIEAVRVAFLELDNSLRGLLEHSRETSIAWTKIEEALMWATKGVCLDDKFPNIEPSI